MSILRTKPYIRLFVVVLGNNLYRNIFSMYVSLCVSVCVYVLDRRRLISMDGRFHSLSRTPNCTEVPIPNCSGKNNIQQGAKWIKTWIFVSNWFNSMSLFTLCIHTLVIDLSALFVLLGIKIECGLPTLIMIIYTLYRMCVCVSRFIHPLILMWSVWKITLNLFPSILPYNHNK